MVIDPPDSGESGLGLRHYLEVVRRRSRIVLAVLVAAVATAALISVLQPPVYRATTKIVVGQGNSLIPPGDAYAIQPYAATMGDLVTSDVVARNVIENLDLKGETPGSLLERTTASINPDTAVVTVSVEDGDKARAVRIGQEIGVFFSDLVEEQFGTTESQPGEVAQLPLTAKVFDPAHPDPNEPVSPKPVQNVLIAAVLGLVLALLAAFLREHFDRKLRTRESVEQHFGVPVIGEIPFKKGYDGAAVTMAGGSPEVAEAYRGLRASLQYLALKRPLRTILITSASPEQGKTEVTANFAVAIARSGDTAIAVEGDLRRPRLSEALGARKQLPGLTSLLVGDADLESIVADVPLLVSRRNGIAPGSDDRASLLPSGPLPPNPSELLVNPKMKQVLDDLTGLYDYVLVDSPPLLPVADALELARMVDGVIVVARRNRVTSDEARRVRMLVERLDINLLGVVFTDVEPVAAYYGSYEADQPSEARPLTAAGSRLAQEDL